MKTKHAIVILSVSIAASLFALEPNKIDEKILAVVEDRVITSSEVEIALVMESGNQQEQQSFSDEAVRAKVQDLVDERLILLAAEDESLQVDKSRIDEAFKQRWQALVDGYGGESALEAALGNEGYDIQGFKRKTRQQISDFLKKQMFIDKHFGRIDVAEDEVNSFYADYADSLPAAPAAVKLEGLVIYLTPDSATSAAALAKIDGALARIRGGEDFARVAAELSEDSTSAGKGGLLGTFGRGDLLPALDSAAFSLKYDEVSEPIRSPMGYHILKVVDRSAGKITLSHILVRVPLTPDRFNELVAIADTIYSMCIEMPDSMKAIPAHFDSSYKIEFVGDLDWMPISSFPKTLKDELSAAKTGDIIGPEEGDNTFEIYHVVDKRDRRALTLDEDREIIEQFVRQFKTKRLIEKELERLRGEYYIEMRI